MSVYSDNPLGTRAPVILAPMGGVSGGRLARAVTEAGGLGLVGVSYGDRDFVATQLPLVADVEGLWGAGIVAFTFAQHPELLDQVLAYRPPVLALSFGDDEQIKRFVDAGKSAGSLVSVQVHDVRGAVSAVEAGADLVIAQGVESGGHHRVVGQSLLTLIPEVVDAIGTRAPVAAAGGIVDARSAAAAFSLGASAVVVGTRFVAAEEALTSPAFLARLLSARSEDLVSTTAFDAIRGIPWDPVYTATSIRNAFTDRWVGREAELAEQASVHISDWNDAVARDDADQRALFAGQAVGRVTTVQPAAAIVEELTGTVSALLTETAERVPHVVSPGSADVEGEWILRLTHVGSKEEVDRTRTDHVRWVRAHIGTGEFVAAGAQIAGAGGIIITNDLPHARVDELIADDPWVRAGLVRYDVTGFAATHRSPGLFPLRDTEATLVNVALTSDAGRSVRALAAAVEHVASTADGFLGARLLTSLDGDTVVNLAQWESVEQFEAIFDDPDFTRLYGEFADVVESSRYRLYRTQQIVPPQRETASREEEEGEP